MLFIDDLFYAAYILLKPVLSLLGIGEINSVVMCWRNDFVISWYM